MDAERRPRVLMTADTIGGVWTYALDLCRGLPDYDIALATMGRRLSEAQRRQVRRLPGVSVFESEYRLEWMSGPWDDVRRAGDWLLDVARQVQPDVIHLNGYAHGTLAWNAPVVMMAHSCVLSWWQAVKGESAPAGYDRYRRQVTAGLRAADIVAAPTRGMLACIEQHYGSLRNARVIPNGRDASRYRPAESKEPFVLAAGRVWDEAKNIAALEGVAPRLEWPVFVAGDDVHPDGSCRQPAGVHPLGALSEDELADWFARASIYALPARYEPFGLSVLEAALSGCALMLGDIPTLRENWNGAALFVDPADSDALQSAIELLIGDEPLRASLAQRARDRAAQFPAQRMAREWADVYDGALACREVQTCAW